MAKLASLPGSGVAWADVVAYLQAAKAKGLLAAGQDKWLAIYQDKAAGGSTAGPGQGSSK